MKNYPLLVAISLILSSSLFSCQNQVTEKDAVTQTTDEQLETDEISAKVADKRVDKYNEIYGKYDQYLESADGKDKVLLPRYFVINSEKFSTLLEIALAGTGQLFASMDVKDRKEPNGKIYTVSNLIFHQERPKADGSLKTLEDEFLDYGNACPVDCEPNPNNSANRGGFDGKAVNPKEAQVRINHYNAIYGAEGVERFIKTKNGSVLIARYYAFSQDDIKELLAFLIKGKHKFFYVSMGAEATTNKPNTYTSDLIFHAVRPASTGNLKGIEALDGGDQYYDVTTPCPDACPPVF